MAITTGTRFNHYEILTPLGAGGMGEVYRAKDTRLDREVAIKVLPADFANDADRLKRFEQEARATSALNHPNILTIYDIGNYEGVPFIVAELLEGEELRAQLEQGALPVRKAIEYAQQVAAGLAAAHEKGIVHRDLKPENLFVTKDGRVKILDFGLAKLKAQTASGGADSEAATLKPLTDPGVVMGTVGYMSPEQVRGQETDHRSDIFSFGIILHEMLSGQRTFTGDSTVELMNAILKEEPPELSETNAKISPALDKIVRRCLEKKPEQRFQTASDLGFALSTLSSLAEGPSGSRPDSQSDTATALPAVTESLPGRAWLFRNAWLALLVMVIAGLAFGLYKFVVRKETASAPSFESMKITKLTDAGKAGSAAISPDGKYVVHVKEDAGQQSLWVVHIATGSNVQIIAPAEVVYGRMTFSPDGSYIYFVRTEKGKQNLTLYQVPVLGGEPKELNSNVTSPVTFSPDGKRLAFVRNQQGGTSTMLIANADGTGEQPLATLKSPEIFGRIGPAWSPDGKMIATSVVITDGGYRNDIVAVGVEEGAIKPISTQKWFAVLRVAWLADGSGLIGACQEIGSNTNQIYQISYPGGEARKITNDLNDYNDVSLTADSGSMVTVQQNSILNIWSSPDGDASHARQLTHGPGKYEGIYGLRWTPDGKIVYYSLISSTPSIWIMNGDGSNPRQLTQHLSTFPGVSPDGRYILFAGVFGIWRMDINGGNPKQLTNNGAGFPNVSPDGLSVIYSASVAGEQRLWKVPIGGGESVRLTDKDSILPAVSPDGTSIACLYREQENSPWRIAIIPLEGGQPTKLLDVPTGYNTAVIPNPAGRERPQALHWLPDGRSLAYIVTRDGVSNIWSMPIAGGAPKQLTNFTSDQIAWFDLSREGKPTLFSRGATTKDVVLISGFKK